MLHSDDRLVLAPGVRLADGHVVDGVRGIRYAANDTALALLGSNRTLGAQVAALVAHHGVDRERVRRDVLLFAWSLNRTFLANIEPGGRRPARAFALLRLAFRLLPTGTLPPVAACRRVLDTRSATRAAVSASLALAPRAAAAALVAALLALWGAALAGGGRGAVVGAASLGFAVGGALLAHEAAHAVALRGVPAALVTRGLSTCVVHRHLGGARAAWVALAGPATPALAAVAVAWVALQRASLLLALVACPLAGHGLAATIGGRDGRTVCGL